MTSDHIAAGETGAAPPAVDLAIILPAYNEIDGIGQTLDRLRAVVAGMACSVEIVVVDDGSQDGTGARAAACGARVISHPVNQGYGAALRTGVLGVNARAVAIMDADCSYQPEALPELYRQFAHADMAVGARLLSSTGVPVIRRPGKWILNRFASYMVGRRIPDLNSGQRVARRDLVLGYLHLMPAGFSFTSTLTLAMLSNGHHVVYVPVAYERRAGRSKLRAGHFGSIMLLVVRTVVLFSPFKVFLPLGAVLFLFGLVALARDVIAWHLSGTAVICMLSALVVWSVGLLADMISRLQLRPPR